MNTKQKLLSMTGTVIVVTLLVGATVSAVMTACGLGACALQSYLCAFGGTVFCALISLSPKTAVPAAIVAVAGVGAYIAANLSDGAVSQLIDAVRQLRAGAEPAILIPSAPLIAGAAAAVFGIFIHVLVNDRSTATTVIATAFTLGISVISSAAGNTVSIVQLLPAMLGACIAFSHTAEHRITGGHLKAIIPAAIAVAIAASVLPAPGTTYPPLEEAADRVRQLYEDYFSYTHERVAFSIAEKGYDYYYMLNDEPTHMLGGPADPGTEAVMRVTTDDDLLLRGTVRGTYTGHSWTDEAAKSRNLYYDFTRRSRRSSVFGVGLMESLEDSAAAFENVSADIVMLNDGSSTLFIPVRLTDFDMPLKNAVYYNSAGEMFLARNVEKGDEYSFSAREPVDAAAVSALAANVDDTSDGDYSDIYRDYTALPECVEDGVYQIAAALTEEAGNDAEKAEAIMNGLSAGCNYSLDVGYPPHDRDFVSYFLLDSREGYCSYFASAMVVLCRASGIPARYVEGYRVYSEDDGVTNVTGEDAHAWAEVYLRSIGWVPYDPTPGRDVEKDDEGEKLPGENPEPTPTPEPTPEPTPTPEPDSAPQNTPTPEPNVENTPTPEPDGEPSPEPTDEPPVPEDDTETPEDTEKDSQWLWILIAALILLLIIALLVLLIRKRLENTDPIRLAAKQKNDDKAAMILYRSVLTLLMQLGQAPLSGETPEAFADRLNRSGLNNPDFAEFSHRIALSRYSRNPADRALTALGARAYLRFRQQMKRMERLHFDIHRVLHGLGDFESIP